MSRLPRSTRHRRKTFNTEDKNPNKQQRERNRNCQEEIFPKVPKEMKITFMREKKEGKNAYYMYNIYSNRKNSENKKSVKI